MLHKKDSQEQIPLEPLEKEHKPKILSSKAATEDKGYVLRKVEKAIDSHTKEKKAETGLFGGTQSLGKESNDRRAALIALVNGLKADKGKDVKAVLLMLYDFYLTHNLNGRSTLCQGLKAVLMSMVHTNLDPTIPAEAKVQKFIAAGAGMLEKSDAESGKFERQMEVLQMEVLREEFEQTLSHSSVESKKPKK